MMFRSLVTLLVCFLAAIAPSQAAGGGGETKKKDAGEKGSPKHQKEITTLESWVSVYPIAVSIVQDDAARGQLQVWLGMDVVDEALRARAEEIMPRLRDAWISGLSQYASTAVRARKPASIDDVSRLLQSTADQVLGKPGSRVLIGSVIVTMR